MLPGHSPGPLLPHDSRTAAATNALDAGADIAKVQEWLGRANISTTRVYDHQKTRPEDSPVFSLTRAPGGTLRPRGRRRPRWQIAARHGAGASPATSMVP